MNDSLVARDPEPATRLCDVLTPETLISFQRKNGYCMSLQDVKDWVNSMNQQQLAQVAYVWTDAGPERIVGTTITNLPGGYKVPRLVGESSPIHSIT